MEKPERKKKRKERKKGKTRKKKSTMGRKNGNGRQQKNQENKQTNTYTNTVNFHACHQSERASGQEISTKRKENQDSQGKKARKLPMLTVKEEPKERKKSVSLYTHLLLGSFYRNGDYGINLYFTQKRIDEKQNNRRSTSIFE